MRIEAADIPIDLAITGANGAELGIVSVAFSELFEFFAKSDEDAKAADDQKADPPYSPLPAFKAWLCSKGMPVGGDGTDGNASHISDELFGLLLVRTRNQIPHIQKKMLEPEHGKPS